VNGDAASFPDWDDDEAVSAWWEEQKRLGLVSTPAWDVRDMPGGPYSLLLEEAWPASRKFPGRRMVRIVCPECLGDRKRGYERSTLGWVYDSLHGPIFASDLPLPELRNLIPELSDGSSPRVQFPTASIRILLTVPREHRPPGRGYAGLRCPDHGTGFTCDERDLLGEVEQFKIDGRIRMLTAQRR